MSSRPTLRDCFLESLHLLSRELAVLICYGIMVVPHLDQINSEDLKAGILILLFLISLIFVIGGGHGSLRIGGLFTYRD
jgi:hypothetical protein